MSPPPPGSDCTTQREGVEANWLQKADGILEEAVPTLSVPRSSMWLPAARSVWRGSMRNQERQCTALRVTRDAETIFPLCVGRFQAKGTVPPGTLHLGINLVTWGWSAVSAPTLLFTCLDRDNPWLTIHHERSNAVVYPALLYTFTKVTSSFLERSANHRTKLGFPHKPELLLP